MTTVDFELEIGRNNDGGYPVVARGGGQFATTHLPAASIGVLDRQVVAVRSALPGSSELDPPVAVEAEQQVRELGRQLFDTLVADEVRDLYVANRQRADEQSSIVRLRLGIRPVELTRLPWEYLFDPDRAEYLGLRLSLVRYLEAMAPRQPLRTAVPLRILGMVVPSADQDAPEVDQEQQRLGAALEGLERDGLLELGWVAGQTHGDAGGGLQPGRAVPGHCERRQDRADLGVAPGGWAGA